MKRLILIAALFGCMVGCGPLKKYETKKIDGVQRVFMHQPGQYSVLVLEGNELKSVNLSLENSSATIKLVTDAQPGKMWVEGECTTRPTTQWKSVTIHVTSATDVEGGGFKVGKNQAGRTNVVK